MVLFQVSNTFLEEKINQFFFSGQGLMSVPSLSTLEGVKRYINAVGNTPSEIAPKQTVMLDWASKEDGSHILTITVGNKVIQGCLKRIPPQPFLFIIKVYVVITCFY